MTSITNPPERIRLLKAVESAFLKGGWHVDRKNGFSEDFEVSQHRLFYVIRCIDETRILYSSAVKIVTELSEKHE